MNTGVPRIVPASVRLLGIAPLPAILAMPKSSTLITSPCGVSLMKMLEGLISRWMMPCSCAIPSTSHTGSNSWAQRFGVVASYSSSSS